VAGEESAPWLAYNCRTDEASRLVRREAEEDLLDEVDHVLDTLRWCRRHGICFHVFERWSLFGG
jgi:hypothetical protein